MARKKRLKKTKSNTESTILTLDIDPSEVSIVSEEIPVKDYSSYYIFVLDIKSQEVMRYGTDIKDLVDSLYQKFNQALHSKAIGPYVKNKDNKQLVII